jgi:methylenetetrahydrofolate reductase (NADPH)
VARIVDLLADGPTFSFEFFPPRNEAGEGRLREALGALEPLRPSFVSVTYGAGGSTRERTHGIVVDILHRTTMTPMAHLTAIAHTTEELRDIVTRYRDAGVENILALHGDPPRDEPDVPPGDLSYAYELVELVREVGGDELSVGVATHPEGHPASTDRASDRRHQATKLARADFGITQFFFRSGDYLGLVDDLARLGVDRPVIPGIMPVTNVRQIERFAELSGADLPPDLVSRLRGAADQPEEVRRIGVEVATDLCDRLLEAGAPGLHFYTLNRSTATREIFANLGLRAAQSPSG